MSLQRLFAKTAMATVSTANPSMDASSGAVATVFTAGEDGATISSITIKATANTTPGLVRIFVSNGGSTSLIMEYYVRGRVISDTVSAAGITIPLSLDLETGASIKATTSVSQTLNVIVSATQWENCSCG